MNLLKKAILAAGLLGLVVATPSFAWHRHYWRHHHHTGVGLLFGAVAGLMVGAAIASSNHHYYSSCRRVVVRCRTFYGPYGQYRRCNRVVRWVR